MPSFNPAPCHFRFEAKVIGRAGASGAQRSAAGAVAYRAGLDLADARTGELQAYARRGGVLRAQTCVLAPAGSPAWMLDPATLAARVELAERRRDAQLFREFVIDLPDVLNLEQQVAALHAFVDSHAVAHGMAALITIHEPHDGDGAAAPDRRHAHVLLTMRRIAADGDGFGPKEREWNNPRLVEQWRAAWADTQNAALAAAGWELRCTPKSIRAQAVDAGLDPEDISVPLPQPKRGPRVWRGPRDIRSQTWLEWQEAEAARREAVTLRDRLEAIQAEIAAAESAAADEVERRLEKIRELARQRLARQQTEHDARVRRGSAEPPRVAPDIPGSPAPTPAAPQRGAAAWEAFKVRVASRGAPPAPDFPPVSTPRRKPK